MFAGMGFFPRHKRQPRASMPSSCPKIQCAKLPLTASGAHGRKGQQTPVLRADSRLGARSQGIWALPRECPSSFAAHLGHLEVLFLGYRITNRTCYWQ